MQAKVRQRGRAAPLQRPSPGHGGSIARVTHRQSDWPVDTTPTLQAFYGTHVLGADGTPTTAWVQKYLTRIVLPYPMVLAWDHRVRITRLTCHRLVAPSLRRILGGILDHYGSQAGVRRARMHLFGGAYNYRRLTGAVRLSVHAWGAAIDLDPEYNPLGRAWRADAGMMPTQVVQLFEAEGWRWGGRFKTRADAMHFQATR